MNRRVFPQTVIPRGAVVEWIEWHGYGAESFRSEFEAGLCNDGKTPCQSSRKWVPF